MTKIRQFIKEHKKLSIILSLAVFFYIIGINSEQPTKSSDITKDQKISSDKEPKRKTDNKKACINMFDAHAKYMNDTTKWWDGIYSMEDLVYRSRVYSGDLMNSYDLASDDLRPYFQKMIDQDEVARKFFGLSNTLDTDEWFNIIKEDGDVYNKAVDYCQKFVK
jgi:hypothetical protein